jgi:hypothetical protein
MLSDSLRAKRPIHLYVTEPDQIEQMFEAGGWFWTVLANPSGGSQLGWAEQIARIFADRSQR